MAISQDEWNGELTRFLDRLPARPCIMPPPPSFCTVCGRLNNPVASVCKFYPLRFERETGRTSVEPAALRPRRDTFEIDIGFEEEEEEPGLAEAPMIEFERPARPPAKAAMARMKKAPSVEAEVEVVEAELVEVIDESEAEEEELGERAAGERKEEMQKKVEGEVEDELKAEVKALEELEKKVREDWELEEENEEELLSKAKDVKVPEGSVKPAPAITIEQQEVEPAKEEMPIPPEKIPTIAPIYPQPKLRIIDVEKPPKVEEQPLPPPPPDYKGPMPSGALLEEMPKPATPSAPEIPEAPVEPVVPALPEKNEEEKAAPSPGAPPTPVAPPATIEGPAAKVEAPTPPARAPEKIPAPTIPATASPTTGRRTGGLYDIFRKKPTEPKKEGPKPDKEKVDEKKKASDEELLKRLKNIDKEK